MIKELVRFFVVLLVVVEPITLIPAFIGMTEGYEEGERRRMARRAIIIAALILTLFAVGGGPLLKVMGISINSFRIFGGLLLFLIALEMAYARPSGTRSSQPEQAESLVKHDVSVFPLAFPLIAGPGALATILLAFGSTGGNWLLFTGLLVCVFVVLAITLVVMYTAGPAMRVLGVTGTKVIDRLSGVLLGALAVQFVVDGVRGSFTP